MTVIGLRWGGRLLRLVLVGIAASFLTFASVSLIPGDPALAILGEGADAESIATINEQLGLNQPFFERYVDWTAGVVTGDLGQSLLLKVPVSELVMSRLPVSLELVLLSTVMSLVAAVALSLASVWREGGWLDRFLNALLALGLGSPNFVLALFSVALFSIALGWFPAAGYVPFAEDPWRNLQHLVLPSAVLAVHTSCLYARVLRRAMLDVLHEPFVDTAVAKGVGQGNLLVRHVLRNSLLGLVTIVGVNIGFQLSGAVILESIFGLPGLGQLLIESVLGKDYTVVQGIVLISVVGYVVINVLVDATYPILDPRTRHDSS